MPEYVDSNLQEGLYLDELVDHEQEYDHGPWSNGLGWLGANELSLVGRAKVGGGPGGSRNEPGRTWEVGRVVGLGKTKLVGPRWRTEVGQTSSGRPESGQAMVEPG
ncbi:unnamed protein product [Linum trigynum]|uniref:Uncharacterized protein n=1 Tax=Linum trigynum TaxID=586398 RepID=A0AAV2G8L0_9ROSI